MISFTFDDFPSSALSEGGAILEGAGAVGTYYVSQGLLGQPSQTGLIVHREGVLETIQRGHELGCHTFHHHPAWETASAEYESSVRRNASVLMELAGAASFQSHSYPISYPRPGTKRRLASRFRACRGGGQCFNHGTIDLNYVSSFFLEQSRDDFAAIERLIAATVAAGGWLIFSTHDISDAPTRFGCRPDFFRRVVHSASASGAKIVKVSEALDVLGVPQLR